MKRILTTTVITGMLAAAGTTDAATILFTEDFESPNVTGDSNTNALPTGWASVGNTANFEYLVEGFTGSGEQVLWIRGGGSGKTGAVVTTASILSDTVVTGSEYTVSFDWGGLSNRPYQFEVELLAVDTGGGETQLGTSGVIGNGSTNANGNVNTPESFSVTPTTNAGERLAIKITALAGGTRHNAFDNVVLEVVPEPGSLALLGMGALCLAVRRRRA